MEAHPEITICGSWETVFGKNTPKKILEQKVSSRVELPLIQILLDDMMISSVFTVRRSFIEEFHLSFEHGDDAEIYKFWVDTALSGGGFYIESQPLVYRRTKETDMSRARRLEKLESISKIKQKILPALCEKYLEKYPALTSFYNASRALSEQKLLSDEDIFKMFHTLFMKNAEIFKNNI